MPVLELGGSIGVVSRVIRATIGPDARHLVVEANPDLVPICRDNALRDASADVTEVIQAAVAYTDAESVRFARGETHHSGHVARNGDGDTFTAPALRLSELVSRMPDGPWAWVSDIEGGEYDIVMQEDPSVFANVSHSVMEIHPEAFTAMGGSEDAFLIRLDQLGFDVLDRTADVLLLRGPAG
nr:FkbM family methyltransferase [Sulfitobacter aestuariivivens]